MQTNEFAGHVQHGAKRPHAKKALPGTRAMPENRAQGPGADESRPRAARQPPRKPHHYGAGF